MRDEQYIVFDGSWRDDDQRFVQEALNVSGFQSDLGHLSPRQLALMGPVWKFECTTLRTGTRIYTVSSLVFRVFAAAPSLPRLLGKVHSLLHDDVR
ncbi:MAG: hypothetical protein GVY18_03815 [Bacteroidetes bacterium]|jgi:hypothetical protein|nr:hypothetical protein [Bacteroidota bacterium]